MSRERLLDNYLTDIVQAIDDVEEFIDGMDFPQFAADKRTLYAVIRSLEVLGEATKHIPSEYREKHPDVPWSKMAGIRDVLIHGYMSVDFMTVWKVAKERLPDIKPLLVSCLKNDGDE